MNLHIICERDAGLFSLIQQVIANIPWAILEGRIPVVHFQGKTCYWTPDGYHDKDTVWEYYFEPPNHALMIGIITIPSETMSAVDEITELTASIFELAASRTSGVLSS